MNNKCHLQCFCLLYVVWNWSSLVSAQQTPLAVVSQCNNANTQTIFTSRTGKTGGGQSTQTTLATQDQCASQCAATTCAGYEYTNNNCILYGSTVNVADRSNAVLYLRQCVTSSYVCDSPYQFEIWPQKVLVGFARREIRDVGDLATCLGYCLDNVRTYNWICRSGMWYSDARECILNTESRYTRSDLWVDEKTEKVDYFDNSCAGAECPPPTIAGYLQVQEKALSRVESNSIQGITYDACADMCTYRVDGKRSNINCKSFTYTPARAECNLTTEQAVPFGKTDTSITPDSSYNEKHCFKGSRVCVSGPTYIKVPQFVLVGFAAVVYDGVPSIDACVDLCSNPPPPSTFKCLSGMYYYRESQCILNTETRKSRPELFVPEAQGYVEDYFEPVPCSFCANDSYLSTIKVKDFSIPAPTGNYSALTKTYNASTVRECLDKCQNESLFTCRSFNFQASSFKCILSFQTSTANSLQPSTGTDYYELTCVAVPCNDGVAYVNSPGQRLQSPVIRNMTGQSLTSCLNVCFNVSGCKGVNYYKSSSNCELVSQGLSKARGKRQTLQYTKGVDYYQRVCTGCAAPLCPRCTYSGMDLSYIQKEPFTGSIWAKMKYATCRTDVENANQASLFLTLPPTAAIQRPSSGGSSIYGSFGTGPGSSYGALPPQVGPNPPGPETNYGHAWPGLVPVPPQYGTPGFAGARDKRQSDYGGLPPPPVYDGYGGISGTGAGQAPGLIPLSPGGESSGPIAPGPGSSSAGLGPGGAGFGVFRTDQAGSGQSSSGSGFGPSAVPLAPGGGFDSFAPGTSGYGGGNNNVVPPIRLPQPPPVNQGPGSSGSGLGPGGAGWGIGRCPGGPGTCGSQVEPGGPGDCGVTCSSNGTCCATVIVQNNPFGIPGLLTGMDGLYVVCCDYGPGFTQKVTAGPIAATVLGPTPAVLQPRGKLGMTSPVTMELEDTLGSGSASITAVLGDQLILRWENTASDDLGFLVDTCVATPYGPQISQGRGQPGYGRQPAINPATASGYGGQQGPLPYSPTLNPQSGYGPSQPISNQQSGYGPIQPISDPQSGYGPSQSTGSSGYGGSAPSVAPNQQQGYGFGQVPSSGPYERVKRQGGAPSIRPLTPGGGSGSPSSDSSSPGLQPLPPGAPGLFTFAPGDEPILPPAVPPKQAQRPLPGPGLVSQAKPSLVLMLRGCVTPAVSQKLMPSPVLVDPKSIPLNKTYIAPLQAFRFDGYKSVQIQCTIKLCKGPCKPAQCIYNNSLEILSWGRKKRGVEENRIDEQEPVTEDEEETLEWGEYTIPKVHKASAVFTLVDRLSDMKPADSSYRASASQKQDSGSRTSEVTSRRQKGDVCLPKSTFLGATIVVGLLTVAQLCVLAVYASRKALRKKKT